MTVSKQILLGSIIGIICGLIMGYALCYHKPPEPPKSVYVPKVKKKTYPPTEEWEGLINLETGEIRLIKEK